MSYTGLPNLIGFGKQSEIQVFAEAYNSQCNPRFEDTIHHLATVVTEFAEETPRTIEYASVARTLRALGDIQWADPDSRDADCAATITYLAHVAGNLGLRLVEKET